MSDQWFQVIITIIAALPGLLVSVAALIKITSTRHDVVGVKAKVVEVEDKVVGVHDELNSRLSEWKAETRRAAVDAAIAAFAAGKAEEKEKRDAQ